MAFSADGKFIAAAAMRSQATDKAKVMVWDVAQVVAVGAGSVHLFDLSKK